MTARDAAAERALLVLDLVVGGLSREGAETKVTAFEQAYRAELAEEFAARLEALDRAEAAALRRMAPPTTTKEQCGRCNGSGIDPEHSSPGCTDPDRGVEPPTLEPCIACQYPKEQ